MWFLVGVSRTDEWILQSLANDLVGVISLLSSVLLISYNKVILEKKGTRDDKEVMESREHSSKNILSVFWEKLGTARRHVTRGHRSLD